MRGQGALEYLIIIAAVLGISAVVVLFVAGAFTGSSGGADISKCRLAAANCQRDLTLGLGTSCTQCESACKDASGKDLFDKTSGPCGLACSQCKSGSLVTSGGGPGINLAGYWSMDEGKGIIVSDASGNGNTGAYVGETFNDGTLTNGPSWTGGTQGNAVLLDGLNDYVAVRDVPSLKYTGGEMTIGMWINADVTENQGGWILSKPWNGNGSYNYGLQFRTDKSIEFRVGGATPYSIYTPASAVPRSSWHYIAATVNSLSGMKIYIDGIERASGTHNIVSWTPGTPGDSNLNLAIGTLYPYGSSWGGRNDFSFNGTIDSVRLWNRALNQTEIQAEMASSRPIIRPLADWEFEENGGPFANDTHIWVAGRKGTALSFDGVNNFITIPDSASLNISKEVTVAAWIKSNQWGGPYGQEWKKVAGKGQWGSAYHLWPNGGARLTMTISGGHYTDDTTNLPLGSWIHIAGVYNTTHVLLYYNGALIKTLPGPASLTTNNQPFVIGKDGTSIYYYFNGSIDEVRVFNRSLSSGEIAQLYSQP